MMSSETQQPLSDPLEALVASTHTAPSLSDRQQEGTEMLEDIGGPVQESDPFAQIQQQKEQDNVENVKQKHELDDEAMNTAQTKEAPTEVKEESTKPSPEQKESSVVKPEIEVEELVPVKVEDVEVESNPAVSVPIADQIVLSDEVVELEKAETAGPELEKAPIPTEKPIAPIDIEDKPPAHHIHPQPPVEVELEGPQPHVDSESTAAHPPSVKDYSDLLAEFEADHKVEEESPEEIFDDKEVAKLEPVSAAAQLGLADDGEGDFFIGNNPVEEEEAKPEPIPTTASTLPEIAAATVAPPPIASAAALFADDDDSAFDIGLSTSPSNTTTELSLAQSQAGDTSFQSMFTEDSNWLGDTSIDESIHIDTSSSQSRTQPQPSTQSAPWSAVSEDGNEPIPFEVPQGWYDDNNEWNWYTDEQREQVRLAMIGQTTYIDDTQGVAAGELNGKTPIASPQPVLSENVARRTPVPSDTATMPSSVSVPTLPADPYVPTTYSTSSYAPTINNVGMYDPYNPAPTQQVGYGSLHSPAGYVPASTSTYAATSGYAPQQTPYSASSPYDPYAPSPYAPISTAVGSQQAAQSPKSTTAPPTKPSAPKRVASNAYDPPFLRPQKSFIRPASVTPAPIIGFSAAASNSPPTASQPQTAARPPPPPSGPPRRSKTPSAATPAYAPPPPAVPAIPVDILPGVGAAAAGTAAVGAGYEISHQTHTSELSEAYSPYDPPNHSQPPSAPPDQNHRPMMASSNARPTQSQTAPPKPSYSSFDPPLRPPSAIQRPASRSQFTSSTPARTATPPIVSVTPPPQPPASRAPTSSPRGPQRRGSPFGEEKFAPPRVSSPLKPHGSLGTPYEDQRQVRQKYDQWGADEMEERPFGQETTDDAEGGQWGGQEVEKTPPQESASALYNPYEAIVENHPSQLTQDPYAPTSSLGLQQADSSPHGNNDSGKLYQSHQDNTYQPHSDNMYQPPSSTTYQPHDNNYQPQSGSTYQAYPDYTPQQGEPGKSHATPTAQLSRQSIPSYEPSTLEVPSSSQYASATDPYGRVASPAYSSEYGVSPPGPNYFQSMTAPSSMDSTYVPQQVLEQRPISEDPLGRCTMAARNAPIAVFGFNGQIITAFPGISDPSGSEMSHSRTPSYGYASGRGQLWIRHVSDVVEPSALKSNEAIFPGPLVLDPSATKGAAAEKKKREAVIAYLEARADELERGIPYLKSSASHARREAEGKLVVVRLLAAMVHGDGKIFGNAKAEESVRAALAPPTSSVMPSVSLPTANGFNTNSTYNTSHVIQGSHSIAASPAHLTQLSKLLLVGDKRGAAAYAAEAGLWTHALIISSSVDQELWRDLVERFAVSELEGTKETAAMKAAYALFSGGSSTLVDDLVSASNITDDPSNDQWREVLSAVIFNGKPTDLVCLDELGNRLSRLSLINAAQACYLLSANSPFTDVSPGAFERRVMLVEGTRDEDGVIFAEVAEYARSLVPTPKGVEPPFPCLPQLLPYKLDRAWRAAELGDGELAKKYCNVIEAASKPGKNARSRLPRHLAASMDDLLERLTGQPSADPAMGIGGRRRAKSSATIGSWIEGRLTKFIAGDDEPENKLNMPPSGAKSGVAGGAGAAINAAGVSSKNPSAPVGPFSHFSTISPAPSVGVSRVASTVDVTQAMYGHQNHPSDSLYSSPQASYEKIDSSRGPSYGDQYNIYGGTGGGNVQSTSYSPWGMPSDPAREGDQKGDETPQPFEPYTSSDLISPMAQLNIDNEQKGYQQSHESNSQPTTSKTTSRGKQPSWGEEEDDDDLGFGNSSLSRARTPAVPTAESSGKEHANNTSAKDKKSSDTSSSGQAQSSPGKANQKGSSGWLRGWWGKKEGEGGSGPIRANLGEESSMVFDPELKRWVVKGAKGEKSIPTPIPPPPRAQTASPSRSIQPDSASGPPNNGTSGTRGMSATPPPHNRPPSGPPIGGPPPRIASAPSGMPRTSLSESITASDLPTGVPAPGSAGMNNGPPENTSGSTSGSSTPSFTPLSNSSISTSGNNGPNPVRQTPSSLEDLLLRPPSSNRRPASGMRKPAKSRYVDVFQQGGDAA